MCAGSVNANRVRGGGGKYTAPKLGIYDCYNLEIQMDALRYVDTLIVPSVEHGTKVDDVIDMIAERDRIKQRLDVVIECFEYAGYRETPYLIDLAVQLDTDVQELGADIKLRLCQ